MSRLDNLKTRLDYYGGVTPQGRIIADKLRSLKGAMRCSYMGATAVLEDGRKFRCLITPDKLNANYDEKIISIPYKDVCLNKPRVGKTSQGLEDTGFAVGTMFEWEETGTYWLTYIEDIYESAYFKAEIRRCDHEIEINGKKKRVYVRGPLEESIDWRFKNHIYFNKLNYTLAFYIPSTEENLEFFHRFKTLKFRDKPYEVQAIDDITTQGLITVYLKEYFSDPISEEIDKRLAEEETPPEIIEVVNPDKPVIIGPKEVYPFDSVEYKVENAKDGQWSVSNDKVKIVANNGSSVKLNITTGRKGSFILYYKRDGEVDIEYKVTILNLM